MEFKSRCVLKAAEGPPFFYRRKPAVNNSHFEYNQRIRSPDLFPSSGMSPFIIATVMNFSKHG